MNVERRQIKTERAFLLGLTICLPLLIRRGWNWIHPVASDEREPENAAILMRMQGPAMEPTIHDQSNVWVDTSAYRHSPPQRGDIVAFSLALPRMRALIMILRIIGVPGDVVAVQDGYVVVNGARLDEPYIHEAPVYTLTPQRIPRNRYFLLGDHRTSSFDSAKWGRHWLPRGAIIGKVIVGPSALLQPE